MNVIHVKPIKSDEDFEAALKRIDEIFECQAGSREADELDILVLLCNDYEEKTFTDSFPKSSPVEVLKFVMEQHELKQKDLVPFIGTASRVSEVLSGKRQLTLEMIRSLSKQFNIPVEILI